MTDQERIEMLQDEIDECYRNGDDDICEELEEELELLRLKVQAAGMAMIYLTMRH